MPRPSPTGPRLVLRRGVWCIEWIDAGRRRFSSTGETDSSRAKQALVDFENSLEKHPKRLTLDVCLTRYATERSGKVQAHDRLTEAAAALRHGLGPLRVDQVTQSRWDAYAAARVTRPRPREKDHVPRPVSTGTLRREYNVLRAALNQAWKDGLLDRPPTIKPPGDSTPRDRYLTKDEARRLIDAAKTPHVKVFVALALMTGARKASVLSLTWDRVDLTSGMVDFREPGRAVTSKRRSIVPLTSRLKAILTEAHQVRQSDYVVEYGGRPVPTGLRWSWRKLCQNAGLDWMPTPHHMKHSAASWFAMDGVSIDQASDWLATDPVTLRKTYRKFDPTYLRTAATALDL